MDDNAKSDKFSKCSSLQFQQISDDHGYGTEILPPPPFH